MSKPSIPASPLDTLDVWLGVDLAGRTGWTYGFTPSDIAELVAAQTRAAGKDYRRWTRDDFVLPTLSPKIESWMRELDRGRGFMLLRGFPVARHSLEVCTAI
ncbi:MAG: TauD/TfdA family dioxygenase, partial [Rhizomicrobium sp.]